MSLDHDTNALIFHAFETFEHSRNILTKTHHPTKLNININPNNATK